MTLFTLNLLVATLALAFIVWLQIALLWRMGSWFAPRVQLLVYDEGLPIGAKAPELAVQLPFGGAAHLNFKEGGPTFIVFGTTGCDPCRRLLDAATKHPFTKGLRLIYVVDQNTGLDPHLSKRWEVFGFGDENKARRMWNAPVSPYFHLLDSSGRVVHKGVANSPEHLDWLLNIRPESRIPDSGLPTTGGNDLQRR